jgi:hypothetical protein
MDQAVMSASHTQEHKMEVNPVVQINVLAVLSHSKENAKNAQLDMDQTVGVESVNQRSLT